MSGRREILLIVGLFVALVLFIIFGPTSAPPPPPAAATTHSTEESGAQALYTWVGQMGFEPRRLEYQDYALDDGAAALVVLGPTEPVSPAEARETLDWVERGGVLIFADETSSLAGVSPLLDELKFETAVFTDTAVHDRALPLQPALDRPSVGEMRAGATRYLVPRRDDYAALVGADGAPLVAGVRHGAGYVFVSATVQPFTNGGLRDEQSARMVVNMLRRVPAGGVVLFDEVHHGYVRPPTPTSAVLGTPWGWAGVYAALTVALYLVLSGRRFGRPVPLREEAQRRSSAEYVESVADMLQRGAKQAFVLRHYREQFKRQLARPHGLSPALPDEEFARAAASALGADEAALRALLARLADERAGEQALVRAVDDADRYLAEHAGRSAGRVR